MNYDQMPISMFELSVNATNAIMSWKRDATFGDVRAAFECGDADLVGRLRVRDRRDIDEMLANYRDTPESIPDPAEIIRNLLEHAVYDRERSDECIAAVEAAEAYLSRAA